MERNLLNKNCTKINNVRVLVCSCFDCRVISENRTSFLDLF